MSSAEVVKNKRSISTHADEDGLDKSRDEVENRDRRFEARQKVQGLCIQRSHLSEELNRCGKNEEKNTYEFPVLILLKRLLIGNPTRDPSLELRENWTISDSLDLEITLPIERRMESVLFN